MIVVNFGNVQDYLKFFLDLYFCIVCWENLCNFESNFGNFGTIMKVFERDTSLWVL